MLNKIGYINSIDYDAFLEELKPLDRNARCKKYWENKLYNVQQEVIREYDDKTYITINKCDEILLPDTWRNTAEECYKKSEEIVGKIKKCEAHNKLFNKRFEVKYLDDDFVAFMYSLSDGAVIPREYVDIEMAKDYSALTYSEMNNLLSDGNAPENALAVLDNKTYKNVQSDIEKARNELQEAENKAKQELEEFEREMRKQEMALRAKQEQMLAELRTKVEGMKDQIFILEMNIFALRSYFGETFSIAHVMKGKNAPDDQPLVLFQKFRYMDEDLSRLSANSEFSTEKTHIIDLFDKYGDLFIETFCPNTKCITFFKNSRDNKKYAYDRENDVIEELEYYHGNQIGMLIRNGENLYLSFIDEEITLQDNLFVSEGSSHSETAIKVGETKLRDKDARPMFNRKHIFIIIQALLRNTNIYNSLKGEHIFESDKIILSSADAQIQYNKYPTFREFFRDNSGDPKANIIEGDEIFIDERHAGSKTEQNVWGSGYREEHRGVGYRNTGRDADIDKGINKINLIIKGGDGFYVSYHEGKSSARISEKVNSTVYRKHVYDTEESIKEKIASGEYIDYEPYKTVEYYVSCERDIPEYDYRRYDSWTGKIDSNKKFNNANLRVWSDEFMSIMFLNSNYVQQWIDTKEGGRGKNYVYFVKSLKELREHLLKREEEEFKLINKYYEIENSEWNKDVLLDWKLKNNVRRITEFQAKRFAKYLKEMK